jgi:hypothetical protein
VSALEAVYSRLSATPDVTDLVGANIEPQTANPADRFPVVLLQESSLEHSGTHGGSDGIATARLSISCEATSYTTASDVAAAVRASLNFQKGAWGGVVIQGSFVDDEAEDYEFLNGENVFYGTTINVTVVYEL